MSYIFSSITPKSNVNRYKIEHSRMKGALLSKSKLKVMLIIFLNIKGVSMIEWAPEVPTGNQKYYKVVPTKLKERVGKKRSDSWMSGCTTTTRQSTMAWVWSNVNEQARNRASFVFTKNGKFVENSVKNAQIYLYVDSEGEYVEGCNFVIHYIFHSSLIF